MPTTLPESLAEKIIAEKIREWEVSKDTARKARDRETLELHPFYKSYMKASEVEKQEINALIHVSTDYTPNQYWFNLVFLWTIFFTTFWFLGLMTQGVINLMRRNPIIK